MKVNWSDKTKCYFYFVRCDICGASGGTSGTPENFEMTDDNKWDNDACRKARAKWNNRRRVKNQKYDPGKAKESRA